MGAAPGPLGRGQFCCQLDCHMRSRIRLGGLWRHRNFRRLWAAHSVSQIGSSVTLLALPLVAVLTLDASAFQVGLLTAAGSMPILVFGLLAGVWVDRRSRLPIMVAADLGRAALLILIPLAAWLDVLTFPLLLGVSLIVGTLTVFFDIASQSMTTNLLERSELVEGNSKLQTSYAAAEIVGPGLAGTLIQIASAPGAVVVDAASFLASALFLRGIDAPEIPAPPRAAGVKIWHEIAEGIRTVVHDPILRTLTLSTSLWNLFENARYAMLVLFLSRELDLAPGAIGAIFAIGSVGFLLGSVLPAPAARRLGLGRAILVGVIGVVPGDILIAVAGGPKLLAATLVTAGWFLGGLAGPVYDVNQYSLRQAVTPDRLRGRVSASIRLLIRGIVPIGAIIGGLLAEWVGLRAVMFFGILGGPVAFVLIWRSPVRTLLAPPEEDAVLVATAASGSEA